MPNGQAETHLAHRMQTEEAFRFATLAGTITMPPAPFVIGMERSIKALPIMTLPRMTFAESSGRFSKSHPRQCHDGQGLDGSFHPDYKGGRGHRDRAG